jgi:hypothetical protein
MRRPRSARADDRDVARLPASTRVARRLLWAWPMRTFAGLLLVLSLAACDDGDLADLDPAQADVQDLVPDALYWLRVRYVDVDHELSPYDPYVSVSESSTGWCDGNGKGRGDLVRLPGGVDRCYPPDGGVLEAENGEETTFTGHQLIEGVPLRVFDWDPLPFDDLLGEALIETTRTGTFEVTDLGEKHEDAYRVAYQVLKARSI